MISHKDISQAPPSFPTHEITSPSISLVIDRHVTEDVSPSSALAKFWSEVANAFSQVNPKLDKKEQIEALIHQKFIGM